MTDDKLENKGKNQVKESPSGDHVLETGKKDDLSEVQEQIHEAIKTSQEDKEWRNKPATKENIEKYFSEEHLASLTLEEYIDLLKIFPGEMVVHVTRQGVRDHADFIGHQEKRGEFHEGFGQILNDGSLHSLVSGGINQPAEGGLLKIFLERNCGLPSETTKEEALKKLEEYFKSSKENPFGVGNYGDKAAIHFTVQEVADKRYGGEKNNEIFLGFPSAFVASQTYFNGVPLTESTLDKASDLWIWSGDNKGIDIDAGVVFIPANTEVDPETGSKYRIENGKPILAEKNFRNVCNFAKSESFKKIGKKAKLLLGALSETYVSFYDMDESKNYNFATRAEKNDYINSEIDAIKSEVAEEFAINNKRLLDGLFDYRFFTNLLSVNQWNSVEEIVKNHLMKLESLYLKPKKTISSKEYWEKYFTANPEKKPSKMVYYSSALTPSEALINWEKRNNLNLEKKEDEYWGFGENIADDQVALRGMEEFESLLRAEVDKYYS